MLPYVELVADRLIDAGPSDFCYLQNVIEVTEHSLCP